MAATRRNPWIDYAERVHAEFRQNGFEKLCTAANAGDVDEIGIEQYHAVLNSANDERPLQRYLTKNANLLVGELGARCRWVLPQVSFGGRYVADFLTARLNSTGVRWHYVELETPSLKSLFTGDGLPVREFRKGLKQINDWRRWVADNRGEARRPRASNGLGLPEISDSEFGVLIIGRSSHRTDENRDSIRQLEFQYRVYIRSYDSLIREAQQRIEFRRKFSDVCEECAG